MSTAYLSRVTNYVEMNLSEREKRWRERETEREREMKREREREIKRERVRSFYLLYMIPLSVALK